MNKKSGIYVITNNINGKQYVGLSKNIIRRWNDHKNKAIHPIKKDDIDKPLYKAMRKYGTNNFSIKILEEIDSNNIEDMKEKEKFYIAKLDLYYSGYDATFGGDGVNLIYGFIKGEDSN